MQQRTEHFPVAIQRLLINRYKSHTDRVKANTELRHTTDKLNQLLPPVILHNFNAGEDELRDIADEYAEICRQKVKPLLRAISGNHPAIAAAISRNFQTIPESNSETAFAQSLVNTADGQKLPENVLTAKQSLGSELRLIPEKNSEISEIIPETKMAASPRQLQSGRKFSNQAAVNAIARNAANPTETIQSENSVNAQLRLEAQLLAYERCANFINGLGLTAPTPDKSNTVGGCIKRMQDKHWWLRVLRKLMVRKTEECMLHLNKVHKHAGIYCSDITASNRKYQKARQLKMLESISLVNEHDQRYSLREIYDLNISNPVNRRNVLMTRMRGFEDIAKELGHIGDFITLTCPSKYHAAYAKSGNRNPNWQGFTPHQGQQYLCGIWAKIRAELDRQEIRTYGLRVAEPQHDGTPHWHLMLFVEPENLKAFRAVINHYAFQEDGDEAGARENRVKFVAIDPSKGSATGYVAKYICKNIDGANLDEGVYGENPIEAAERVEAWASCWGIRQFQQIGGVSVTVWRELRRLRKLEQQDITLTAIHQAADTSNWQSFVTLMGGVFCKRKEQTIRPHYDIEIDTDTGQISTDYYDGFITTKLKGICYLGKAIITRLHQWRIEFDRSAFRSNLEFCK
ncbi:replication endonuclease [Arsukibacterium perlucidum]|uniref:replication endonuclease n=1 Tax=Arsukibacterium perlucidum TaxID=368811 RepID=UPI001F0B4438|nr:replication endonuclease [Arsukibacterium perlucidum]